MSPVLLPSLAWVTMLASTDAAEIDRLVGQLGNPNFADQVAATRRLELIGKPALAAVRKAATDSPDAVVRERALRLSGCGSLDSLLLQGTWECVSEALGGVRLSFDRQLCTVAYKGVRSEYDTSLGIIQGRRFIRFSMCGRTETPTFERLYRVKGDELSWSDVYATGELGRQVFPVDEDRLFIHRFQRVR